MFSKPLQLDGLFPDGAGLVPLTAFYSQPETADYQFTESTDYLHEVGAFDETDWRQSHVRDWLSPLLLARSHVHSPCKELFEQLTKSYF